MAALQSDVGKKQVQHLAIPEGYIDSLVLIKNNTVYTHSDAVLELIKELGGAWKILTIGKLLPKKWRDSIYKWIAKNRYKWFGKKDSCIIPSEELKGRFL